MKGKASKGKLGFIEYYGDQVQLLEFQPPPVCLLPDGVRVCASLSPEQLAQAYVLNAASLKPVVALNPQPGETILDACAAPGGKTVAIAHQLNDTGQLYSNDSSPKRYHRLKQTVTALGYNNIKLLCKKAETLFKRYPNYFDGILLDAPCSSEKHVWHSPKHLAQWSPSRIKRLKQQQIALLNGLWLALKPGGRIVYATCAVNTEENEAVIADFQKRHPEAKLVDQTRITPDAEQFDPMFYARLDKV